MELEALTLVVAIAVPIIALLALVRLILGLRSLERSRDELIELEAREGRSAVRKT